MKKFNNENLIMKFCLWKFKTIYLKKQNYQIVTKLYLYITFTAI